MAYNKEETGIKTVIKLLLRCIKLYESLDQVKKVLKTIVQLESTQNQSGIGSVLQLKAKLEDMDKAKDELAAQLQIEIEMGMGPAGSQKALLENQTKTPPSEGNFVYPYTKSINESSEKQLDLASRMDAEEEIDEATVTARERKLLDKAFSSFQKISRQISLFMQDNKLFKQFIYRGAQYQETILNYAVMLSDLVRKYAPDDENLNEKYGYVTLSEETGCLVYYPEEPKDPVPSEAVPVRDDDALSEIADLNKENLQMLVSNWIDNDFEKIFIDPDYYKDPEGQLTVYENDGLN